MSIVGPFVIASYTERRSLPRSMKSYQILASPLGGLTACEENGRLLRLEFGEVLPKNAKTAWTPLLKQLAQQLGEYFEGVRKSFDIPLELEGTSFRKEAWNALRAIPYGQTKTYGQQAKCLGNPKAARAVGQANHHNPISIIVPCHRVVGSNGKLTGYASGVDKKSWLLEHEQRCA